MKCPQCQTKVTEKANYCSECGQDLRSEKNNQPHSVKTKASASQDLSGTGLFRSLSGLRRTLSTEVIVKEEELHTLTRLNALIESRTYQPGEVIVHKGEKNRDLFFLTDGLVEISTTEHGGNIVLNQITAPTIFGEIGFLFGFPRTATAIATTASPCTSRLAARASSTSWPSPLPMWCFLTLAIHRPRSPNITTFTGLTRRR